MLQRTCASHKGSQRAVAWVQEGNEIYMSEEVAQMIAMQEDDDDEEDDPDYEPLSMEDDSIQPREMVSTTSLSSYY